MKCTEEHYFGKNDEFKYYCTKCFVNICPECVGEHMYSRDKFHQMILLDFEFFNNYEKLKIINEIMKEENNKNNSENNLEANKIILFNDKALMEEKNDEIDYFKEYINIIFKDYLNFNNLYHTYNIGSIYNFIKSEHFGVKIKYIN